MNEEKLNKTISTYNWNSYVCKKRYTVQYHITEYVYENTVCSLTNTFKVFQKSYREKGLLCKSKNSTEQLLHLPRKEDLSL